MRDIQRAVVTIAAGLPARNQTFLDQSRIAIRSLTEVCHHYRNALLRVFKQGVARPRTGGTQLRVRVLELINYALRCHVTDRDNLGGRALLGSTGDKGSDLGDYSVKAGEGQAWREANFACRNMLQT